MTGPVSPKSRSALTTVELASRTLSSLVHLLGEAIPETQCLSWHVEDLYKCVSSSGDGVPASALDLSPSP